MPDAGTPEWFPRHHALFLGHASFTLADNDGSTLLKNLMIPQFVKHINTTNFNWKMFVVMNIYSWDMDGGTTVKPRCCQDQRSSSLTLTSLLGSTSPHRMATDGVRGRQEQSHHEDRVHGPTGLICVVSHSTSSTRPPSHVTTSGTSTISLPSLWRSTSLCHSGRQGSPGRFGLRRGL